MDQITDQIYIGNTVEAHDVQVLSAKGIRSILSLDGSYIRKENSAHGLQSIYAVELVDGPGNSIHSFQLLTDQLIRMVEKCPPVLIHCHAVRSRSVAAASACLVVYEKRDPSEAIAFVCYR